MYNLIQDIKENIKASKAWTIIQEHNISQDDESSITILICDEEHFPKPNNADPQFHRGYKPPFNYDYYRQTDGTWKTKEGSYIQFNETNHRLYVIIFDSGRS